MIANLTALPEYRDRPILLETDSRAPLTVRGREGEIKQVILNLLINALQAGSSNPSPSPMGHGGDEDFSSPPREALSSNTVRSLARETKVSIARAGDHAELAVVDHGRGMDADALERVFEPFFTSWRGSARGTGLGLSITHAIIADHGGSIAAYSEGVGLGSRFIVRLPMLKGAANAES